MEKSKEKQREEKYINEHPENDMPFESPQTEESRRLSKLKSADAVERKDNNPDDEGKTRGGNFSVNQG